MIDRFCRWHLGLDAVVIPVVVADAAGVADVADAAVVVVFADADNGDKTGELDTVVEDDAFVAVDVDVATVACVGTVVDIDIDCIVVADAVFVDVIVGNTAIAKFAVGNTSFAGVVEFAIAILDDFVVDADAVTANMDVVVVAVAEVRITVDVNVESVVRSTVN